MHHIVKKRLQLQPFFARYARKELPNPVHALRIHFREQRQEIGRFQTLTLVVP